MVCGQTIKTINIERTNTRPVNLSEIAEKVTPIALETSVGIILNGNVLLTNEYLFITSHTSVIQYDLTGKFIRNINCEDFISYNVTSDTIKKELYVPVGNLIKCYDYSGKLKKEYSLKMSSLYCLYHKGVLWALLQDAQPDRSIVYTINKVNLTTGEVAALPFEKKIDPVQFENGPLVGLGAIGRISLYDEEVVVSFDFEEVLYKIQQDRIIPFVQWNVSPPAKNADVYQLRANGFTGENLFINYRCDDQFYIYLENIKTGMTYNVSNLIDDVFFTNRECGIYFMNQGYFYFLKDRSDIKGSSVGNIPLKNGPVIFIVKTK